MVSSKKVVLVLGIPRSGTSTLTRGLETMGIGLGSSFTPANPYNQKGDYEDVDFQLVNTTLLQALQERRRLILPLTEEEVTLLCQKGFLNTASELVLQKTAASDLLGIKDPRFSIFLPFWKKVFEQCNLSLSFVISLRNPWSVAASTRDRHKLFKTEHLEKLFWHWSSYLLSCLEHSEGYKRIVVDYNELLKDPAHQMKRVATALQCTLHAEALHAYCHDFIDATLCHFQEEKKYPTYPLTSSFDQRFAMEIYEKLLMIARDQTTFESAHIAFATWKKQFLKATSLLVLAEKNDFTIEELQREISDRKNVIFELNKKITQNARSIASLCQRVHQRNLQLASLQQTNSKSA